MDFSSPLPNSSAPGPTPSSPLRSSSNPSPARRGGAARRPDPRDAYNQRRRAQDPLMGAFSQETVAGTQGSDAVGPNPDRDDAQDGDNPALEHEERVRRHRANNRARNQNTLTQSIPPVKDRTGEAVTESFTDFLTTYKEDVNLDSGGPESVREYFYLNQIRALATSINGEGPSSATLFVDVTHLFDRHDVLARAITDQYYRFLPFLKRAVVKLLREQLLASWMDAEDNKGSNSQPSQSQDGGVSNRATVHTSTANGSAASDASGYTNAERLRAAIDALASLSASLQIAFHSLPLVSSLRDLRTPSIGTLLSVSGTVTRTSEVRPELVWGAFECLVCNSLVGESASSGYVPGTGSGGAGGIGLIEQQFKYTEPSVCPNLTCGNRKSWRLRVDDSVFVDWQKVRIQENAGDIPTGSMPRSLDVILRGDMVERAKAGDKCIFTGTFIVVPDVSQLGLPGVNSEMMRDASRNAGLSGVGGGGVTGLKTLGVRDLQYKTAFLACMVNDQDPRASGVNIREDLAEGLEADQVTYMSTLTEPELMELQSLVHSPYIYDRLVNSIAPTVWGHEIVKKGILLQLLGGVHKQTPEGMHLRGDLNICIVGDPSTSKSQFLKYVCSFLPRAVYTSGKASSAAGLTAAVVRDEESGEFTIEAGALMLADNGICAIDEFDKMDISDQVAIHEAMEQQTISIAKAGIHATLNARTSILAAANPVGGRYNRKASLRANVGAVMSAPIMSRFDLFFVVLDECNAQVDERIAKHIVEIHQKKDAAITPPLSTEQLQRYIRFARTFNPKFTSEASDLLVEKYRVLRQDDSSGVSKNSYRITVRQLESMIRLSEAIARANCMNTIYPSFVNEAYSLLRQSIIHVDQDDIDFDDDAPLPGSEALAALEAIEAEHNARTEQESSLPAEPDSMDVQAGTMSIPRSSSAQPAGSTQTQGGGTSAGPSSAPAQLPAEAPKPKMKITYDEFMSIQTLLLLELAERERTTGKGMNRDDILLWWIEKKETTMEDVVDIEYQEALMRKVLTRLVKDNTLLLMYNDKQSSLIESQTQSETPATTTDDSQQYDENGVLLSKEQIDDRRMHFMIHPSVDVDMRTSSQV